MGTAAARKILENAADLAEEFQKKGYRIVYGGTDNHIVLLDLRPKRLSGNVAEAILESVGILTNKNVIPYDPEKPMRGSGLRLGTSAISSRRMGKTEVVRIADLIDTALAHHDQKDVLDQVARAVSDLCQEFPVYK